MEKVAAKLQRPRLSRCKQLLAANTNKTRFIHRLVSGAAAATDYFAQSLRITFRWGEFSQLRTVSCPCQAGLAASDQRTPRVWKRGRCQSISEFGLCAVESDFCHIALAHEILPGPSEDPGCELICRRLLHRNHGTVTRAFPKRQTRTRRVP